jgi:hypothetical protein
MLRSDVPAGQTNALCSTRSGNLKVTLFAIHSLM